MARMVLVEFDDDAKADAFIGRLDAAPGKSFRVVGIFASPTRWCGCPRPTGYHKDEIVQGSRFGWWIHVLCKRPRMGSHQARNLMPPRAGMRDITMVPNSISLHEVPTANI